MPAASRHPVIMVGELETRGSGPYESAFAVATRDDDDAIAQARRIAHDTVIANSGKARTTGVLLTHYPAKTAIADLHDYGVEIMPELRALCDLFPAGVLVMATVAVDEEVTP